MNTREFFAYTLTDEIPRFVRVLEALPSKEEMLTWKPDPKARNAFELASVITAHASIVNAVLQSGEIIIPAQPVEVLTDMPELVTNFTAFMSEAKETAANMPDKVWDSEARMLNAAGEEEWKNTRGNMAWEFLLDMIHHRGQLSVYIRPLGGMLPSIYGPSADSRIL